MKDLPSSRITVFIVLLIVLTLGVIVGHFGSPKLGYLQKRSVKETTRLATIVESGKLAMRYQDYSTSRIGQLEKVLRHDLAMAVLQHWVDRNAIDSFTQEPGHAREFAGQALNLLGCTDGRSFVKLAKEELWLYPEDELIDGINELVGDSLVAFDQFIASSRSKK